MEEIWIILTWLLGVISANGLRTISQLKYSSRYFCRTSYPLKGFQSHSNSPHFVPFFQLHLTASYESEVYDATNPVNNTQLNDAISDLNSSSGLDWETEQEARIIEEEAAELRRHPITKRELIELKDDFLDLKYPGDIGSHATNILNELKPNEKHQNIDFERDVIPLSRKSETRFATQMHPKSYSKVNALKKLENQLKAFSQPNTNLVTDFYLSLCVEICPIKIAENLPPVDLIEEEAKGVAEAVNAYLDVSNGLVALDRLSAKAAFIRELEAINDNLNHRNISSDEKINAFSDALLSLSMEMFSSSFQQYSPLVQKAEKIRSELLECLNTVISDIPNRPEEISTEQFTKKPLDMDTDSHQQVLPAPDDAHPFTDKNIHELFQSSGLGLAWKKLKFGGQNLYLTTHILNSFWPENFVSSYFSLTSLVDGGTIPQSTYFKIKKEIFGKGIPGLHLVHHRKSFGATIFSCEINHQTDFSQLTSTVNNKLAQLGLSKQIRFTVMLDEYASNVFDAASSPTNVSKSIRGNYPSIVQKYHHSSLPVAIVMFPSSWTPISALYKPLQFVISWIAVLTTISFSAMSFLSMRGFWQVDNDSWLLFDPKFSLLVLSTLLVQFVARIVETIVAYFKSVDLNFIFLPSLGLSHSGSCSSMINMPESRRDVFDITLAGFMAGVATSLCFLVVGVVDLHSESPFLVSANTPPKLPASILQMIPLHETLFSVHAERILSVVASNGGDPLTPLNWAVIAGISSLFGYALQMLPIGVSAGNKILFSLVGLNSFQRISFYLNIALFGFFWVNLFFDIFPHQLPLRWPLESLLFSSYLAQDNQQDQAAVDNISSIGIVRFLLLISVLGVISLPWIAPSLLNSWIPWV